LSENNNNNNLNVKKNNDLKSELLREKAKFYEKEDFDPDVKNVIDDVFNEMIKDNDIMDNTINFIEPKISDVNKVIEEHKDNNKDNNKDNSDLSEENIELNTIGINNISVDLDNQEYNAFKHKLKLVDELESFQKSKKKELEQKIEEYKIRYKKLEEKLNEYDERNRGLLEKRKEYEDKIKEFERKTTKLEESKGEFVEKNKQLDSARELFKNLSKSVEEKKLDLEKLELKMKKMENVLEKNKQEFEKKKIEFENEKIDFERGRTELELNAREIHIMDYEKSKLMEKDDSALDTAVESKGKVEILHDLLQELSYEGDFQSCFLIDGRGMIISENSNKKLNTMAIGAMFSLVCTSLLRTVNSLSLQDLEYFKLSSTNGEFMLKNINLSNYERNFILLAHYDKTNSSLPKLNQKLTKKSVKKILKSIKDDFYEYDIESKISWIFDNLIEKVNFLKQKYTMVDGDLEAIRINLMYKVSIKIKHLFENL